MQININYNVMPIKNAFMESLARKNIENIQNHLTCMCANYFQEYTKEIHTIP